MFFYLTPCFKPPFPFLDSLGAVTNAQKHHRCADFEFRTIECVAAYGWYNGQEKCREMIEDFYECIYKTKQIRRQILMMKERERQGRENIKAPPLDLY